MDDDEVLSWYIKVKLKVLVVGFMIKYCKDRLKVWEEINDFISEMKEDL